MNICIPVNADQGVGSEVCAHFGSAPFFMIVDTDTRHCRAIPNQNLHHAHGMCQPLMALQGEVLGGIVVGGIGMGALNKLQMAGVKVYLAQHPTVEMTLAAFAAGELQTMTPAAACGGHGQQHGHGHNAHGR
jgi:predicted Fe-Mo cluster-binding NifX family protein